MIDRYIVVAVDRPETLDNLKLVFGTSQTVEVNRVDLEAGLDMEQLEELDGKRERES